MIELQVGKCYSLLHPVKVSLGKDWEDLKARARELDTDDLSTLSWELPTGSEFEVLELTPRESKVANQAKVSCLGREGWVNTIALIHAIKLVGEEEEETSEETPEDD